ncbi:hypothetical protein LTS15_010553 [Exophiala xenobiotica]|nr:hypothetical protein LTS15_010553 [Exophiala xenobiotica]
MAVNINRYNQTIDAMSNRSQSSTKVTVAVIKDCDHTVEVRVDPSQSSTKPTVALDIKHCDQAVKVMVYPSQSSVKVNVAIDLNHCHQTVEANVAIGIGSSSQATPSIRRKRAAASLSEQQDVPPSKRIKAMVDYFTTSGQADDLKSCLWDIL